MIDIDKMVTTLNIPDGMTVDEMRRIVVDVLDMAKASNEAEKAIATENATLKTENDRLAKQNLELFNRVTTSISPSPKTKDDDKEEMVKNKMMVLDENGEVQMQLDGGERIFSRHDTKILIKLSKKAYESKDPEDYKKLGKKLFKFLEIQMGNDTQYVELKDK